LVTVRVSSDTDFQAECASQRDDPKYDQQAQNERDAYCH
jgi:hypothetical protein